MVCATLAMARGEGLAGAAVLVALVVLVLSFVVPTGLALGRPLDRCWRSQAEVAATHRSSAACAAPESIASAAFVTPAASAESTSESGES